jgi:molybdopterin-containing oxidoreductase family iron-sulfur binding subunit
MPKSAGFAAAFAKVPFKVSFTSVPDETAQLCDLILPDNHWLESWGDAVSMQGQIGLQQPTLEPVFDTKATADVLIALAKKDQALAAKYTAADYRGWFISKFPGGGSAFTTALTKATSSGAPLIATALSRKDFSHWTPEAYDTLGKAVADALSAGMNLAAAAVSK